MRARGIVPGAVIRVVRWLLVIPAALAAWNVAGISGYMIVMGVDLLCPAEQMISGACVAPWYPAVFDTIVCVWAAPVAFSIMIACTWMAPSHKRLVAIATFVAGACFAIYLGQETEKFVTMVVAIVTGAITLWFLVRKGFSHESERARSAA